MLNSAGPIGFPCQRDVEDRQQPRSNSTAANVATPSNSSTTYMPRERGLPKQERTRFRKLVALDSYSLSVT